MSKYSNSNSNPLASIHSMNTYGIPRSSILVAMRTEWNIPAEIRPAIKTYFLRVWDGAYMTSKLANGYMVYNDTVYICIFRRHLTELRQRKVILSFRESQAEYGLQPYVLIDALHPSHENESEETIL